MGANAREKNRRVCGSSRANDIMTTGVRLCVSAPNPESVYRRFKTRRLRSDKNLLRRGTTFRKPCLRLLALDVVDQKDLADKRGALLQ